MTISKSCSDIHQQSKDLLAGNYQSVTLFILSYYIITSVAEMILTSLAGSMVQGICKLFGITGMATEVVFFPLTIILSAALGIFNVGVTLYFLNLTCKKCYHSSNLLYGFQTNPGKSFLLSLVVTLVSALCLFPFRILAMQLQYGQTIAWSDLLLSYLVGTLVYLLLSAGISQIYFLLLDFPDLSVKKILCKCWQIMKGAKWDYIKLQFSFLPLLLLGVLSLGIGLIWVLPYLHTASAVFFLNLMDSEQAAS